MPQVCWMLQKRRPEARAFCHHHRAHQRVNASSQHSFLFLYVIKRVRHRTTRRRDAAYAALSSISLCTLAPSAFGLAACQDASATALLGGFANLLLFDLLCSQSDAPAAGAAPVGLWLTQTLR
jgi:hypothetical protein